MTDGIFSLFTLIFKLHNNTAIPRQNTTFWCYFSQNTQKDSDTFWFNNRQTQILFENLELKDDFFEKKKQKFYCEVTNFLNRNYKNIKIKICQALNAIINSNSYSSLKTALKQITLKLANIFNRYKAANPNLPRFFAYTVNWDSRQLYAISAKSHPSSRFAVGFGWRKGSFPGWDRARIDMVLEDPEGLLVWFWPFHSPKEYSPHDWA